MERVTRLASGALGIITSLSTIAVSLGYVMDWARYPVYRSPPTSQAEYFFGSALIAALGVLEAVLALRPAGTFRATAMTALGGALLLAGAIASARLDQTGSWLFYSSAVGLLAAAFAVAAAPRRFTAAAAGLLAAVPLALALGLVERFVGYLFP